MRSDDRSSVRSSTSSFDDPDGVLFNDVFGGPPKYTNTSSADFNCDSIFKSGKTNNNNDDNIKTSSLPVYDKPVYGEDMFDELPGVKSKSVSSSDDVFPTITSPNHNKSHFDDLLGNLGINEPKTSASSEFGDLLAGFASASPGTSSRVNLSLSNKSSSVQDDPFVVLESTSAPANSTLGEFSDPLEEIAKLGKSGTAKTGSSSVGGGYCESPKPVCPAVKSPPVSQLDELEDFARAAIKEAMDRAEAKVRHTKEVREREYAKSEAQERAAASARMNQQRNDNDLESFFSMGRASSVPKRRTSTPANVFDSQFLNKAGSEGPKSTAGVASSNMRKASSTTSFVDDLSSIFGASASSGEFQDVEGETEERRRARIERRQRTQERGQAKALAEKK
ncbi:hypothetical protein P3S67_000962 [Capsicum chacoense]